MPEISLLLLKPAVTSMTYDSRSIYVYLCALRMYLVRGQLYPAC